MALGHEAVVPDLRQAVERGVPEEYVAEARAEGVDVAVAHSGAGPLLPAITDGAGAARSQLVFVDAGIPPCDGGASVGGEFLEHLRSLAVDGVLPLWSRWWPGVFESLVSRPDIRQAIEVEQPRVPLSFYEARVPLPLGWCERRSGYVLLSDSYIQDARRARRLAWRVVEQRGGHLDTVEHREEVTAAIVAVAQ